ncbi:MAG: hypothetical protein QM820_59680 [Minicystis sp.]
MAWKGDPPDQRGCALDHPRALTITTRATTDDRLVPEGYLEILVAERSEVVRPEPFEAIPVRVSTLLVEDEDEEEPAEAG